jgi:hypothetical protein
MTNRLMGCQTRYDHVRNAIEQTLQSAKNYGLVVDDQDGSRILWQWTRLCNYGQFGLRLGPSISESV